MDIKLQYKLLKEYLKVYETRKTHDPQMVRVFKILLADLESQIITNIKKGLY